jgi:hypothetical protein
MVVRVLLFNILLGGTAILIIIYELSADYAGIRAPQMDKIASFFGSLMTFVGTAATALSIYLYKVRPTAPSPEAYWTVPIVLSGCVICIFFLVRQGHLPDNIVNGFALLGLAGGLMRIQPNPQRAANPPISN